MYRLTKRALEILRSEVQRCSSLSESQKQASLTTMKQLEQLSLDIGPHATLEELRAIVVKEFPLFNEQVLKVAAKANQKPGVFSKFKWVFGAIAASAGIVCVLNFPDPTIRMTVAKTAPILLLPSYMTMENNYRHAQADLEELKQEVNQIADSTDVVRRIEKLREIQHHLAAIPAWFIGYYPESYCNLVSCRDSVSYDSYEATRQQVIHLETLLVEEKNAWILLKDAEQAFLAAKQQYNERDPEKQPRAIAAMQTALDTLEAISVSTAAGKKVQGMLPSYQKDFLQLSQTLANRSKKSQAN